jgi:signal transduction histidine kinase
VRKARDRAGTLAHGLKIPLTILAAEVHRLERHGETEAAARISGQLDLIRRHVDRELARARTAGASTSVGAFANAGATVEGLIRLMLHMPRGDALSWRNEIPADVTLRVDPDDLGEVLGNLLDNARKWARSAVVVRGTSDAGAIVISILDDGPGFALGGPRRDADRGLSPNVIEPSSGLGLNIVRDVLSEYGVVLRIDHHDGWCSVSFTLPGGTATRT